MWMLVQQHSHLFLRDRVFYCRQTDQWHGVLEQLVLPSALPSNVIAALHNKMGHQGYDSMNEPWSCWTMLNHGAGMYREFKDYTAFQRSASTDTKYYAFCVSGTKNVYSIFLELMHKLAKPEWWSCSVNLLFRKSLNRSEHRTQHHFPKMNNSRWCQQT